MNQGPIGVDVDPLHQSGKTISGRSNGADTSARGLTTTLDDASGTLGHPVVKGALSSYVTDSVLDPANKLGNNVDASGRSVSNVAATAHNSDAEGGREVGAAAQAADGHRKAIVNKINPV